MSPRIWAHIATIVALLIALPALQVRSEEIDLSLRNLDLRDGERIIEFELRLLGARFVRLREFPADWALSVDNAAAQTRMAGGAHHGAGALHGDFFNDFVTLEKTASDVAVSGTMVVTRDFDVVRMIDLAPEQTVLRAR